MAFDSCLAGWLRTNDNVSVAVGTRVYPNKLPQGASLPAIVYQLIDGTRPTSLGGLVGLVHWTYQLHVYGLSYNEVRQLALSIAGTTANPALDGFRGFMGGTDPSDGELEAKAFVQAAWVPRIVDVFHEPVHADGVGVHEALMDVEIWAEDH